MIPEMGTRILLGNRISSLPSVDEVINSLENFGQVSAPVAVVAEPVAVVAEPVATVQPSKTEESEEEDMDFDMEWG